MAKGNHYDEQAHCYEDLEGENSNAGETKGGRQYNDDVSYSGGGSKGAGSSSSMGVNAARPDRGRE